MTPERWHKIYKILEGVWDRDATEWNGFLDEVCVDDPALRAEVEALLAADQNPVEFWQEVPAGLAGIRQAAIARAIDGSVEERPESLESIGTRVGPYTIRGLIGEGGMGVVYRAVREDDFSMEVAIKLLKREDGLAEAGPSLAGAATTDGIV